MGDPLRIVIAENYSLYRTGLRLILAQEAGVEVVGDASSGPELLQSIQALKPDVVLFGISILAKEVIELVPVIAEASPGTKILVLNNKQDEITTLAEIRQGISGTIEKHAEVADLIKAVKAVHEGQLWIERKFFTKLLIEGNRVNSPVKKKGSALTKALTRRELEILGRLGQGYTNNEIAQALFISEKTVKAHLQAIFKKLGVNRRLEAVLYALSAGFCSPPQMRD